MPSVIRIGARVSAAVGPLPRDRPESGRRKRATWTGLVIASMPERSWLVLWDPSGQATTHSGRLLKFLEYSTVTEPELQQMRQRLLLPPEPPAVHPPSGAGTHSTAVAAALVEEDVAATAQNVAQQENDAGEQPPPPAAPAQPILEQNPPLEDERQEVEQFADPDGDEEEELQFDGVNNIFMGLDNYQEDNNEHRQKWNWYVLEKTAMLGFSVTKGQGAKAISWVVCGDVLDDDLPPGINDEYREVGVRGFDFAANLTRSYKDAPERTNLMSLLIHLWPGDWRMQIRRVNDVISKKNDENSAKIRKIAHNQRARLRTRIRHISEREFWIFWGIILAARIHGRFGELWDQGQPEGQQHKVDYGHFMKRYRFQQIREVISHMWATPQSKEDNDWWMINLAVDEFNMNRQRCMRASLIKTMDESMSAFRPQTQSTGNLPHLSFIM